MSKKHYIALAAAIRKEYDRDAYRQLDHDDAIVAVAENIADVLYEENPNFNREKFLLAALGE